MINMKGVYYPTLVKEIYTIITQKTNEDIITVKTIVKGNRRNFHQGLFSQIAHVPNEGPIITFCSPAQIIYGIWIGIMLPQLVG